MPKTLDAAATFNDPAERLDIALMPVKSAQLAAVGYHPSTQTLAVTFTRGSGAVYHYAGVSAALHAELLAADSIGRFFGARIQSLPFKKFATAPAAAR